MPDYKIPKTLEKYFKSKNGIRALGDSQTKINEHVVKQAKLSQQHKPIHTRIQGQKKLKAFLPNQDNCANAFAHLNWSQLNDDGKINVLHIFMADVISPSLKIKSPALQFIKKKNDTFSTDAAYIHDKEVFQTRALYINADKLKQLNGLTCAGMIAHELQHCKDFNYCQWTLLPEIRAYLRTPSDSNPTQAQIIKLPIEGTIYNTITGEEEKITPELREKILLLKHYSYSINCRKSYITLDDVKNKSNMVDLLDFLSYIYTPAENRAFKKGIKTMKDIAKQNREAGIKEHPYDTKELEIQEQGFLQAEQDIKRIEELTNYPMYKICDLFHKKQYLDQLPTNTKVKGVAKMRNEVVRELRLIARLALNKLKEKQATSGDESPIDTDDELLI